MEEKNNSYRVDPCQTNPNKPDFFQSVPPISSSGTLAVMSKPPFYIEQKDILFSLLMFICGYSFVQLVLDSFLGIGVTLFTIFYCVILLLYLRCRPFPKGAASCFAMILLSSLSFGLFSCSSIKLFQLLFLMACSIYLVAILSHNRLSHQLNAYIIPDLINQAILVPFSNFFCNFRVIFVRYTKKNQFFGAVLCGFFIAVPLLLIIIPQLIQADTSFAKIISSLFRQSSEYWGQVLLWAPPSILVSCYLFGLFYGNRYRRRTNLIKKEEVQKIPSAFQKLSPIASATTLTLVCIVYCLFLGVLAVNLFTVYAQQGFHSLSYSDFARQGFFQLCGVSFFNLIIMGGAWLFTHTKDSRPRSQRILFLLLSVQTILLIVIAMSKMLLYISRFGLTQKRILTLWFMGLLFIVFLIVGLGQLCKIPVARASIIVFCLCFLLLSYVNVNKVIVSYNIKAYEQHRLSELDISALYHIPEDALAPAIELYKKLPEEETKQELGKFILYAKDSIQNTRWKDQNLQRFLASKLSLPEELARQPLS